jgi:hypothetical protein
MGPGDRGVRETHVGPHVTPDEDIPAGRERALPTTPEADGDRGRLRPAHRDNLFGHRYDHAAITAESDAMNTTVAMIR